MDFEYLDAFARPNASKGYEKKPSIKDLKANIAKTEAAAIAAENKLNAAEKSTLGKFESNNGLQGATNTVNAEANTPSTIVSSSISKSAVVSVKTAPIDTVLFNDDLIPIETMFNLILEDIGGQELINIARNDIINGQKVSYQPIKNLSSIQQQYNPNNILGIQNTSDKYFSNFSIKLENKIPNNGSGPSGSNVYLEDLTGSLVIETVNIENDEQVEIEITVSATIYEAEFGEITS